VGNECRTRIYDAYVSGRHEALAPETLQGLTPRGPYLSRLVRRHFPVDRQAQILDLGCGHGALIHFARQAGYANIRGVDGSPEQVLAARDLGIEGVDEGDVAETLAKCPTASLGCIVAFDVIEHFTRDELLSVADDVKRVLQPGGIWIIHAPNGESPFASRVRYGDLTHELAFTRTSIGQLLRTSGFSDVRSYEDAPAPHGLKSVSRWVMWKSIRAMLRLYVAAETGETGRDAIFSQNFLTVARS
jgi:SAM-dependent methyltransferase